MCGLQGRPTGNKLFSGISFPFVRFLFFLGKMKDGFWQEVGWATGENMKIGNKSGEKSNGKKAVKKLKNP